MKVVIIMPYIASGQVHPVITQLHCNIINIMCTDNPTENNVKIVFFTGILICFSKWVLGVG